MEIRKPKETTKYRAGANTLKVKRVNKKVVQKRKKNLFLLSMGSFLFLALLVGFFRIKYFYITEVNVTGARTEYNQEVQQKIKSMLEGSYFFVIPKRNIFIYPERTVHSKLIETYTNLDKVNMVRSGLHTLDVIINERAPAFYVVEAQIPSNIFIDYNGVIFRDELSDMNRVIASSTPISETSLDYTASSSEKLPIDFKNNVSKDMDQKTFGHLRTLTKSLEEKGFHVFSVTLRPYDDAEIQITKGGGAVRVNLQDDPERTMANFNALRKTEPLKSELSGNRESIRYIDLRFGNKVFYKFL